MCYNFIIMTQKEALDILKLGHNVFLTGSPGTGKTFVLNKFVKYLKAHNIDIGITASTGIAATHIGGQTVHSFVGIGIKEYFNDRDIENLFQNEKLYNRLNKIKVLIIDEISMLQANTLDNIDKVLRAVRRSDKVFGGVQMIFCGDFFQLPPVIKNTIDETFEDRDKRLLKEFAFNAKSWKNANLVICYLKENKRQEDKTLSDILNMIRQRDENIYESMQALYETIENNLDNPIRLYSHNKDVDNINNKHYMDLQNVEEYSFIMKEKGNSNHRENLKKSILALETLKLKKGTKVIFIKNDKFGKYQNGTMGIIVDFDKDENNYPIIELKNGENIKVRQESWSIKDDNDKILAEIEQLPLRYAWAITIHKSQGMTLDEAEIDLSSGFGFGMGYVALSRVKTLSGLRLLGINTMSLAVATPVSEYDKILNQKSQKARESIKKYLDEEISEMHRNKRLSWGVDIAETLSEEEIEKICEDIDNQSKEIQKNITNKEDTHTITLRMIIEGKDLEDVCKIRDLKIDTIIDHIYDIKKMSENQEISLGDVEDIIYDKVYKHYHIYITNNIKDIKKHKILLNQDTIDSIKQDLIENQKLTPVYNKYKIQFADLDYFMLKLIRLL